MTLAIDFLMQSPEERIWIWRDFRNSLTEEMSDKEHIDTVADYWSSCPIVHFFVDWADPDNWMGPWEIIHYGEFCPTGVSIVMAHSLLLSGDNRWNSDRIKLALIYDQQQIHHYVVVIIDDTYVLNFDIGRCCTLDYMEQHANIMQVYQISKNGYEQINTSKG